MPRKRLSSTERARAFSSEKNCLSLKSRSKNCCMWWSKLRSISLSRLIVILLHWQTSRTRPLTTHPSSVYTAYCPSPMEFQNLPGFHSIPHIASNQDAYVRIQGRNHNIKEIGPARDVLLGRNLILCHSQWWLGIHSGQRNKPTHFKTRHCNARCLYITTMKCCDVDVGPLSTSIQLSH